MPSGYLSRDEYLALASKQSPLEPAMRPAAYDAFEEYLKKKKTVFVATKQPEIEEMSDAAVLLTPPPLPPPLPAPPTPSNWDAELDVTFCGLGTGGVQVAEEV